DQAALPSSHLHLPGAVRGALAAGSRPDLRRPRLGEMRAVALTLRREDGMIICENVRVADTLRRRMWGLLGRKNLPSNEGILLRPAWSIHTAFMRFPIDVVFIDPEQIVLRIEPELRSSKTASCRGALEVVELAAGECAQRGLEAGERVAWGSS